MLGRYQTKGRPRSAFLLESKGKTMDSRVGTKMATKAASSGRRRHVLMVTLGALLPLVLGIASVMGRIPQAHRQAQKQAQSNIEVDTPITDHITKERLKVLNAIPKDRNVLVNVRIEHLPGTPSLTLLGKQGLPALEKGLTHNVNSMVRRRIATVLMDIADHHSLDALTAAVKDWDPSVRYLAVRALGAIGSLSSQKVLLKVLDNPEEESYIQAMAVQALGFMGAAQTADRLLSILRDQKKGFSLRVAALHALWDMRLGIPQAKLRSALITALESDYASMIVFAVAAAAELRDRNTSLRAALSKRIRHQNEELRNVSVYALGEIGHPGAIQALRSRIPAIRSGRLMNNIAFALRKLKDPRVTDLLGRLLKHRQAVIRLNAAFVLGDIGDKRAVPMLVAALGDGNDMVRASVIAALGKLKDKRAIPGLVPFLSSKNLALSKEALFALNKIVPGGYNDKVAKLLDHESRYVRKDAALELARHGDERAIAPLSVCMEYGPCSVFEVAWAFKEIKSWRTVGPLVAGYSRMLHRYGARSLRYVLAQKKLSPGHIAVLRSLMYAAWQRPYERRGLTRLLGRLQDQSSRSLFWTLLNSRDKLTVMNASYALANQNYPQGQRRLLNELTQAAPRIKRGIADLIRSLNNPAARSTVLGKVKASMQGHGEHTTAAAAYALTGWDPASGVKALVKALKSPRRMVRQAAARYLTRNEMRPHIAYVEAALRSERSPVVQGMLRRILRSLDKSSFSPKLFQNVPF